MLEPTAVHARRDKQINPTNCFCFPYSVHLRRFSQVVNCCLHFIHISGSGMVTLLTDDSDIDSLKKRPSRGNAAIAVGTKASAQAVEYARKNSINVQSIKSFRAKWVGKNSVT